MSNATVSVSILVSHVGENAPTPRNPIGVVIHRAENLVTYRGEDGSEAVADLSVMRKVCYSFDDDHIVEVQQYNIVDVELPVWLEPTEWMKNIVKYKWLWGMGGHDLPEAWQRSMLHMGDVEQYVYSKLLKQKSFRSEFRKSLRDQLVAWLETPPENRKFRFPLSPRQFGMLAQYDVIEARRWSAQVYNNRALY